MKTGKMSCDFRFDNSGIISFCGHFLLYCFYMITRPESLSLENGLALYEREYLTIRNLAALTRQAYVASLRDLLAYLTDSCRLTHVGQVERRHLEGYLASLDGRGPAVATAAASSLPSGPCLAFWRSGSTSASILPASSSP